MSNNWQTGNTSRSLAPVIRGRVDRPVPRDVHIERGEMRANAVTRLRYETYLNELMSQEYIDDGEHAARVAASRAAVTEADLQLLIEDLPPLPLSPDEEREIKRCSQDPLLTRLRARLPWKRWRGLRIATYIAGICGSLVGGIIAAVFVTIRPAGEAIGAGVASSLVAIVILTVFGVVWSVLLMATDPMWKHKDLDGQWKRNWSS